MENHPIPQDVTGFKFKLIGSVTVKQFLYILGGGFFAGICFILPIPGLIKIPLALFFGGIGAAVAFIPIEGRPMDVMLKNFLKALPSENQYIYKKRGAEALIFNFFTPQQQSVAKAVEVKANEDTSLDSRRALLYKTLKKAYKPDDKEQAVLANINKFLNESTYSASPSVQRVDDAPNDIPPALQIVTPSISTTTKEVKDIEDTVSPSPLNSSAVPDPQIVASVGQKIQNLDNNEPTKLVLPQSPIKLPSQQEAPLVSTQTPQSTPITNVSKEQETNPFPDAAPLKEVTKQAPNVAVTPGQTSNVTTVSPETSLKAGFPQLPDTPNIVLGIVKNPRGKVLPNILVEIMNEQGVPVRAFKTNALGQFAAATPLPNGNYIVILDDPRKQNEFEQIKITLDGKIFNPLEIFSIDQREKLRRELFGTTSTPQRVAVGA